MDRIIDRDEQTAQAPVCGSEMLVQAQDVPAKNFLDGDVSMFSKSIRQAVRTDRLRAGPLVNCVDRTYRICTGLSTILKIASNNKLQEDGPISDEPPLSPNTVYTLLDVGEVLTTMLAEEIEDLAKWAEQHGIIGDEKNADA